MTSLYHSIYSPPAIPSSGMAHYTWTVASRPIWLSRPWSTLANTTTIHSSTLLRIVSCLPGRPRSCDHPPHHSTTPFLRQKAWGQAEYLAGRRGSAAEHSRHPAILHRPPEFIVPNRRVPPTARRYMSRTPPPLMPLLHCLWCCTARFYVLLFFIPFRIL